MVYDVLKYFGIIVILLGAIGAVITGVSSYSLITVASTLIGACAIGLFFIGFGALLQSVHKIQLSLTGESIPVKEEIKKQTSKLPVPGVKD